MRITDKDLAAMRYVFGDRTSVPNAGFHHKTGAAIGPKTRRHLQRCANAGLLTADGEITLTAAGVAALKAPTE